MTDQPSAPLSAVDDLAHRFWEGVLELNSDDCQPFYGDPRYADRLEDPRRSGRAFSRELMERTAAEARGDPGRGPLDGGAHHPGDMPQVIGELGVEEDDQGLHHCKKSSTRWAARSSPAQLRAFQPVDIPERLDYVHRHPTPPTPRLWPQTPTSCASRPTFTAPSIVTERVIAQLERMLAILIETAIIPGSVQGASDADRERLRDVVRDVGLPSRARRSSRRSRASTATRMRGAASGRHQRRRDIPHRDPQPGLRLEMDPEEIHRIGPRSSRASTRSAGRSLAAPGSAMTSRAIGPRPRRRPATHPRPKDELSLRAREDIDRAMGRRSALLLACCHARSRGPPGRGRARRTHRSPTTIRPLLRDRRPTRHLLRQRL